jgi:hypothetical protein
MAAQYQSRAGLAAHLFDLDVRHELCLNTPFAPPLRITTRVGLFCWTSSLRVKPLTVWDVLRRYQQFLHTPVFRLLGAAESGGGGLLEEGLRGIDFLLERTRFVGLKRRSEGWEAILS